MKDDKKTFPVMVLLHHLHDLGVAQIEITYNGGGDDGQIDEISYQSASGVDIKDSLEDREMVENICYKLLEKNCGDWVNNDGGYGTITIEVPSGEYRVDGYLRVTSEEEDGGSGMLQDYYVEDYDESN